MSDPSAPPPSVGPSRASMTVLLAVAVAAALGVVAAAVALVWPADRGSAVAGSPHHATVIDTAGEGYAVWARNDDGSPVRWDPCHSIEIVVSGDAPRDQFLHDLERAIGVVAGETGLDLRQAGSTDERPSADRAPYQPDRYGDRWAPVLIAWASPGETDLPLRDTDRALALPVAVGAPGDRVLVTGQIVLNADRADLRPGFGDREHAWGATLLHELGHLIGLAHVDDPDELMAVHPGTGPTAFGPGDLAGLAAVGADQDCVDVPAPRHVEVSPAP